MASLMRVSRYWQTLRYLRGTQIAWRAIHEGRLRLYRVVGHHVAARFSTDDVARIVVRRVDVPDPQQVSTWRTIVDEWISGFVQYLDIRGSRHDWSGAGKTKLWRYEQQYHRELVAVSYVAATSQRSDLSDAAREMLASWADACPLPYGDAW
jgi:hypothetical protein